MGDLVHMSFGRVVRAKCGSRLNKVDVRPNWKEQPPQESLGGSSGDETHPQDATTKT
jgi:hypothetical protein